MRIRSHSESHIIELDDGSRWQIFPGDLDFTLDRYPETELEVVPSDDDVASHMLVGGSHGVSSNDRWRALADKGGQIGPQGGITRATLDRRWHISL